jgi:lipoyl-dependent peroxiredoxin subunit D
MTLEQLRDSLPEYAKDLKINVSNVLSQAELTGRQTWGTAVACALATRNAALSGAILAEAASHIDEQTIHAAKGAFSVMGMNNIFYRFSHLTPNEKYKTMPARLRMQIIRTHGSDPVDFELWCLAVSAINGCAACVASHEHVVLEKGLTEETVLAAVRIASVMHAVGCVLDAEQARVSA